MLTEKNGRLGSPAVGRENIIFPGFSRPRAKRVRESETKNIAILNCQEEFGVRRAEDFGRFKGSFHSHCEAIQSCFPAAKLETKEARNKSERTRQLAKTKSL